jgi:hypothetical protein
LLKQAFMKTLGRTGWLVACLSMIACGGGGEDLALCAQAFDRVASCTGQMPDADPAQCDGRAAERILQMECGEISGAADGKADGSWWCANVGLFCPTWSVSADLIDARSSAPLGGLSVAGLQGEEWSPASEGVTSPSGHVKFGSYLSRVDARWFSIYSRAGRSWIRCGLVNKPKEGSVAKVRVAVTMNGDAPVSCSMK